MSEYFVIDLKTLCHVTSFLNQKVEIENSEISKSGTNTTKKKAAKDNGELTRGVP